MGNISYFLELILPFISSIGRINNVIHSINNNYHVIRVTHKYALPFKEAVSFGRARDMRHVLFEFLTIGYHVRQTNRPVCVSQGCVSQWTLAY